MLLTSLGSATGEAAAREEERLARKRGLTPFRFRLELFASYVEQMFHSQTPIVLSCERRGTIIATSPAAPISGMRRTLFEDGIVLDLLVFRRDGFDPRELDAKQLVTNSEPLPGFDPIMARLTIREESARGAVCDVAAIDLAKFIVGAHGLVEQKVELQLGSLVSLRVVSDLHGSTAEKLPSSYESDVSEQPCGGDDAPGVVDGPGALGADGQSPGNAAEASEAQGPELKVGTRVAAKSPTSVVPGADELERQSSIRSRVDASGASSGGGEESRSDLEFELGAGEEDSGSPAPASGETLLRVEDGPARGPARERKERGPGSAASVSTASDGGTLTDDGDNNRILLSDHPFAPLVSSRTQSEAYSCVLVEGPWIECPVITEVRSPLPIYVWSIQGPEEMDPDDEEDMMDLGDGTMVPKRNIAKLQAAASCSSTKHGQPTLPGHMSPLQRTYLKPTQTRAALHVALGKPPRQSKCTVLAASKRAEKRFIQIDEPDMSDSDDEDEEGGGEETEGDADLTGGCGALAVDPAGGGAGRGDPFFDGGTHPEGEAGSDTSGNMRENASQVASLMNRVNDLEAEAVGVKQVLKKSKTLVDDLRGERDYLKMLLDEREVQCMKEVDSSRAPDAERVAALERDNADCASKLQALKHEYDACTKARLAAEAELDKLRREMTSESSLRTENERLLTVILSLKRELDREPGAPDVLDELKQAKSDLAMERAMSQTLRYELAQMRSPRTSSKRSGFFGQRSKSKSKAERVGGEPARSVATAD
jgi:hypothetical protein